MAGEAVSKKNIEAREGRLSRRLHIGFQRHNRGQAHFKVRTSDRLVVMRDDIHPIEKNRLDRILPRPERERVIAQRTKIRIEHQGRTSLRRDIRLEVNRQTGHPLRAGFGTGRTKSSTLGKVYYRNDRLVKVENEFGCTRRSVAGRFSTPINALGRVSRCDSRKNRAVTCGQASRLRHILRARGRGGISNQPDLHAALALRKGRYRGR